MIASSIWHAFAEQDQNRLNSNMELLQSVIQKESDETWEFGKALILVCHESWDRHDSSEVLSSIHSAELE